MGAVKSVPVVGELVTAADVGCKAVVGVAVAPFSEEVADKFFDAAGSSLLDYAKRSPVVATVCTPVYLLNGDTDAVEKHWSKVGNSCEEMVDGLPVVGHIKGAVHYAMGDEEHGDQCMKAASRSTACLLTTVATAGSGAIAIASASVAAGLATDLATTAIDSAVHDEFRPSGQLASVYHAVDTGDPVAIFDAAGGVAFEGTMAYIAATQAEKIAQKQNSARLYRVMNKDTASEAISEPKILPGRSTGVKPRGEVWVAESVEHSKTYLPAQEAKNPKVKLATVEYKVDKGFYKNMKANECIPQRGSKVVNAESYKKSGVVKNVFNNERLAGHPKGKVNVGIKNPNLSKINDHVISAKRIDPQSWRFKNGATKAVSRYGAEVAGTAVSETARNGIAGQYDDDDDDEDYEEYDEED